MEKAEVEISLDDLISEPEVRRTFPKAESFAIFRTVPGGKLSSLKEKDTFKFRQTVYTIEYTRQYNRPERNNAPQYRDFFCLPPQLTRDY